MSGINTNRLYLERKRLKLSQDTLASKIGISRVAYANIELGKAVPSITTAVELCKQFKCSLDYLTGISDTREIREPPKQKTLCSDIQTIIENIEYSSALQEKTYVLTLLKLSQKLINEQNLSQEP